MQGTLYGVGVGPGDPELLTLKAVRVIRECAVIAAPDSGAGERMALDIVREYVADKPVVLCDMPMIRDPRELAERRETAADRLCEFLAAGKDVAFLTIGDPTVYSTYLYLHRLVERRGFTAKMVAGVPSFCAAAAALGIPLCEAGQPLHILPASYPGAEEAIGLDGVKVLMKSGKKAGELVSYLGEKGLLHRTAMAERVGTARERLVPDISKMEGEPDYLSIFILREEPV